MAIAFSDRQRMGSVGLKKVVRAKITGPAAYTGGGEPLTNAQCLSGLGMSRVDLMQCEPILGATFTEGAQLAFDHVRTSTTQGKFHIIDNTGTNVGTEIVAAQATFAAFTAWVTAYGV